MTDIRYGTQYDRDMDITDIAKAVRKDIKAAIKAGEIASIKTSVRVKRYSGGQSLDVEIKEAPFMVMNPRRVKADAEGRWGRDLLEAEELIHSDKARETREAIEKIVAKYNYDGSDIMTDYFNVNFYGHVRFAHSLETKHRERIADLQKRGFKVKEKAAA